MIHPPAENPDVYQISYYFWPDMQGQIIEPEDEGSEIQLVK